MSNAVETLSTAPASVGELLPLSLTPKQEAFCRAYLECNNASLAYRRSYDVGETTKAGTVWVAASQVLHRPDVQARIHELRETAAAAFMASRVQLGRFLWTRIMADRAEVIRQATLCCRHCYGNGHLYQWKDELEYATACANAVASDKPLPSCDGGFGFNPHLGPHAGCPVSPCLGHGTVHTVIADTSQLEGGAALIFEGVDRYGMPVLADRAQDIAAFMRVAGIGASELEGALRGAAAGGAAGALAAAAVVDKVKTMDAEDTRRAYLSLVGG